MAEIYFPGVLDIANVPAAARPNDWAERIYRNHPDKTALQALLTRLDRKPLVDPVFKQWEQPIWPRTVLLNMGGGASAVDTILTVDDASGNAAAYYLPIGMMVRVGAAPASGEVFRVVRHVSAQQVEVERGYAGTTAATIADDLVLTLLGTAFADRDDSPNAVARTPSEVSNYAQIFQTAYEYSEQAQATKTNFGETAQQMVHSDALVQHAMERELAMMYGVKSYQDTVTGRVYTTGGVTSYITTHTHDGSGANFSKTNIAAWMRAMRQGNRRKLALCGYVAKGCIHDYVRALAQQWIEPGENKQFGFQLEDLITDGPRLALLQHPLLDEIAPGDIIIVDTEYLKLRYFSGKDFRRDDVALSNNVQIKKAQFYSNVGLQLAYEAAHGYIRGVTIFTNA
jgi:hypothetical protein